MTDYEAKAREWLRANVHGSYATNDGAYRDAMLAGPLTALLHTVAAEARAEGVKEGAESKRRTDTHDAYVRGLGVGHAAGVEEELKRTLGILMRERDQRLADGWQELADELTRQIRNVEHTKGTP